MMPKSMVRVVLSVNYLLSDEVHELLQEMSIPFTLSQTTRHALLNLNTLSAKFLERPQMINERSEVFMIYLPPALEYTFYQEVISRLDLHLPGRGSIYGESVEVYAHDFPSYHIPTVNHESISKLPIAQMHAISMIIIRGSADRIVYELLKRGYGTPQISFANGMGVRNKMGLVRVTIPPQKEVLQLTTYTQDVPIVIDLLKRLGRLHLPGKGIIYHYPIGFSKIDPKTHLAPNFDVASKDQVISAIDRLMSNSDWRRKSSVQLKHKRKNSQQKNLVCATVHTPYTTGEKVVNIGFQVGMGGATITVHKGSCYNENGELERNEYDTCIMTCQQGVFEEFKKEILNDESLKNAWISVQPIEI